MSSIGPRLVVDGTGRFWSCLATLSAMQGRRDRAILLHQLQVRQIIQPETSGSVSCRSSSLQKMWQSMQT